MRTLSIFSAAAFAVATVTVAGGGGSVKSPAALNCDLSQYKTSVGLTAAMEQDALAVSWAGQLDTQVRARFVVEQGRPVIRDLAVRKSAGAWTTLGERLVPEYQVTTGIRRMSEQQAQPLRELGVDITPQVIDRNRWYAFWDAPLVVPGTPAPPAGRAQSAPPAASQVPAAPPAPGSGGLRVGRGERVFGLPRTPEEVRRATAAFAASSCSVKTDGARLEVTFPGLSMGIFSGSLRFTVYRGTNLLRMDAIARTEQPWVAYKYEAGLAGFSTSLTPRVSWHDTGGHPQQYGFGGPTNAARVPIKAQNRVLVAESAAGSIATFPTPHTFFFTREVDTNLGYVWYRKDADGRFGIGIRQADKEENPEYTDNFALYNAPPGTWQQMAVYFFVSADRGESARRQVLAFTHDDAFTPVAGYKTFVNHFHLRFTERLRAGGSLETPLPDLAAMRSLGLNIIGLSDFHGDLHPNDPGPVRFADAKDYADASRFASDKDFLITPWEEPSAYFGGHYNILFPKPVYWSKVRRAGQPFSENDPAYGTVDHTGSEDDVQRMMDAEGAYWYHAHPRTKGTTGHPDADFDKPWAKNDRYLGVAFKPGMGMDLSETRLCEWRCFDSADTMNNLYAGSGLRPKYVIADIDTYRKGPEDDLYPNFPVNYLKLDRVPGPDEDWSPILRALRNGDFFVTTGEILIRHYSVDGTGANRTIAAEAAWTFPLAFVEVVWGDGKTVDRQVIPAADSPPFGSKRWTIPFDARGKAWVRFAIWDSAGNGAFVQPVWLK
jgi:hypothetical protein